MALYSVPYNPSAGNFDFDGVTAGDAAEMESRLQGLIDTPAGADFVLDIRLAGIGQGPEWEALLVFTANTLGIQRSEAQVFAAVAGNKTEAYLKLAERLRAVNAVTPIATVAAIVISGGGDGTTFMALALVTVPAV